MSKLSSLPIAAVGQAIRDARNRDRYDAVVLTYVAAVSLLTEVITNSAAALLVPPIVLQLAEQSGLNSEPFVFAIMMAASASFATPLGYQTNLMAYDPGNYRFTDFLHVGLPMSAIVGIATLRVLRPGWPLGVWSRMINDPPNE